MLLFFFKQKTAYEMRISDWSSDVCSSDLGPAEQVRLALPVAVFPEAEAARSAQDIGVLVQLAMRRRDDVAVFIRGQGHDLVHLFDRGAGETHPFQIGRAHV